MAFVIAVLAGGGGCFVDSTACETDSDCFQYEQCRQGICRALSDAPPLETDVEEPDTTRSDTGDTAEDTGRRDTRERDTDDGGTDTVDGRDADDGCSPPTDETFCENNGAPCDEITNEDECGDERTVDCRPFAGGECPCNYDDKSEGVCTGQSFDDNGNCKKPGAYEPSETTGNDALDNDCNGYVDEVFSDISMGDTGDVVCGIRRKNGSMICWSHESSKVISELPAESDIVAVRPGSNHACAVDNGSNLTCWGQDPGLGQVDDTPTDGAFAEPCVIGQHSCALRTDGTVTCWGAGSDPDGSLPNLSTISCGDTAECGLAEQGSTMHCWSNQVSGQDSQFPPDGAWTQVSAGAHHVCAIAGGGSESVDCWGQTLSGSEPLDPPGNVRLSDIDVGENFACGITDNDVLRCWKVAGDPTNAPAPSRVDSESFQSTAAGQNSMCALTDDGRTVCWGRICDGENEPCSAP